MAKESGICLDGAVTELLPNATFKIKMDNGSVIIGHISGKMRKHDIKILLGDKVQVEFSVYDLTKGRITRRY